MQKKKDMTASLITRWGLQVEQATEKDSVLSEYPRPGMVRENWQCLNGLWKYAFSQKKERPSVFDGDILVPFSPETRLSGVQRQLLPGDFLWYERRVLFSEEIEKCFAEGGRILLHFGAVDQSCVIYVDGQKAGEHVGGYLPFTLDITDILREEQMQENFSCTITLRVVDASDTSYHSVGKQTLSPGGMYYPATSGIWQTVWLEAVPALYLDSVSWESLYDEEKVKLETRIKCNGKETVDSALTLRLIFLNGEYEDRVLPAGEGCVVALPDFISWSPEQPFLYSVRLELYTAEGKLADSVESYFAMRKCSIGTDEQGIRRIFLNNHPYMQVGVLDQGYWPESLYTPPSDEAMIADIETMKNLGFNMLRKHVKVEPERWYYHCDRLGMLVWQDMVNGGRKNKSFYVTYLATFFSLCGIKATDRHRILLSRQDKAGREEYERELTKMVQALKNHPSIVCVVPFNEGWGQFETNRMTELVRRLDKSIIVDQASGWFDMGGGDLKSLHWYFFRFKYKREAVRALALTEFGGYARKIPGHCCHEKEYGYKTFQTKEALEEGYEYLMREVVVPAAKDGISATVYTQLSDVEEEINGLITYDREVLKIDADILARWNKELRRAIDKNWN